MREEAAGPGRRFHGAPLEHPFGRGVNFQIQVANVDRLYARVLAARSPVVLPSRNNGIAGTIARSAIASSSWKIRTATGCATLPTSDSGPVADYTRAT